MLPAISRHARPALPSSTLAAAFMAALGAGCGGAEVDPPAMLAAEPGEELSGGDTTVFDATPNAFSYSARNMTSERRSDFFVGNSFFKDSWVTAPASTEGRDGLGPLYNARSCSACHFKDGRGAPPEPGEPMVSMLIRLSAPGSGEHGGPAPDPAYGGQLQPSAIAGVAPEGEATVTYEEVPGAYGDGEPYALQRPSYAITGLAYGPLAEGAMMSPRTAPAMIGLGLLEAVPEEAIVALADPDDADGDGISGRPNRAWDARRGVEALGRFGWKATQPTVDQQTAGAFLGDMGITTPLFPAQECAPLQADCLAAPSGGEPEASEDVLARVVFYSATLAVPARRAWQDPEVLRGKALFQEAGCGACHTPKLTTGALSGYPELSGQVIRPYTDLLLHDMGEGLSDERPDIDASGSEWRTPPLWGLGLIEVVNGHDRLLHDGRAQGIAEAILWHGGEAEASREAFRTMSREDRGAMLRFLESL